MKTIKLKNMTIRNFKGIQNYELDLQGNSINVFGDNGTGKTTLYDAFLWCLFGKDSSDQSDSKFDWKPLDEKGNEINHLETQVIITMQIDNNEKELSRMISEKWTKKRGSTTDVFDGHTTEFKLDGILTKKKDYTAFLEDLINETTFKILTNVDYFPEKMDWKSRREVLIDMVGDISDADVIAQNKELEVIPSVLNGKTVDEQLTLTKQQMRQINKDIKSLPGRIDEVSRSLPDLSELDKKQLESDKKKLQEGISKKQEEISTIRNGFGQSKVQNDIDSLKIKYKEKLAEHNEKEKEKLSGLFEQKQEASQKLNTAQSERAKNKNDIKYKESEIEQTQRKIDQLEKENEKDREKFFSIRDKTMEPFDEHKKTCPTCGQDYPEEKLLEIQDSYEKEVSEFNQNKATELADIQESGKNNNAEVEKLKNEIKALEKETEKLSNELSGSGVEEAKAEIKGIEKEIKEKETKAIEFEVTNEAEKILTEVNELKKQLKDGKEAQSDSVEEMRDLITEKEEELNRLNDSLYQFELHNQQSKRKEELIVQEGELGERYGELEQQLNALEEFARTKINLLTDTINDKFDIVKFKLFDTNINGGLEEICEPTVNGANYSTGLNNAARINAGLDIINALMDHYQIKVPIFIDNSESINDILDIDTQQIALSVSKHKKLRVEEV